MDSELICMLPLADDLVLLAEREFDLQILLDFVTRSCEKWKLKINKSKTKVVHFRKPCLKKTTVSFYIDNEEVEVVNKYKYLGIVIDEHLNYNTTVNTLCCAA